MAPEVNDYRCAAAMSAHPDAATAIGEVLGAVLERIDPHPDAAVLFVSGIMVDRLEQIVAAVNAILAPELFVGSTVYAVFDSHGESVDGVALWALSGPPTSRPRPLRLTASGGDVEGLPAVMESGSVALLFGDAAFPIDSLAAELLAHAEGVTAAVGLPPRRSRHHDATLIDHDLVHYSGAVGILIPPGAASIFGFEVRLWEDDDPIPDPPIYPNGGRGGVLIAEPQVDLSGMTSLDLEVLYDELSGGVVGMVGRPYSLGWTDDGQQRNNVAAAVYGQRR
ncbi:MAG: hypothetical protein ACRBK7_28175 [Acidimicrobiales bacterium]